MKYIKSFNESSLTYNQTKQNIEDILLPISDLGYDIDVNLEKGDVNKFYVRVVSYTDTALEWSNEIEEEFDRLELFVKSNDFDITEVLYVLEEKDGRVFNRSNRIGSSYGVFKERVKSHDTNKIVNLLFVLEQMDYSKRKYQHLRNRKEYESVTFDLGYQKFDDIMESLNIWHDALLSSIDAEEVDIFESFNLIKDDYVDKMDIDYLFNNIEFINSLSSLGLKKTEVKNSDDYQTFLNKPCKYMFIYDNQSNELENPEYLIFQVWNETLEKWDDAKLYKVKEDVKRFYDKLTSRTIEIIDGDENFIYSTSNGSEWLLQNIESENDVYKRNFRKEELQELLNKRNVKVSIV